jgi:hypothetical protein
LFKNPSKYIKHPYTAGVIITLWVGTLGLYHADQQLPIVGLVFGNVIASLVLAFAGFRPSR